jgi:hypothetical protein
VYIYINRDDYAFIKQAAYAELYPVTANPAAVDFITVNDSTLKILLNTVAAKPLYWEIYTDDDLPVLFTAAEPFFKLKEGIHNYNIFTKSLPDTIKIKAEYISKNSTRKNYSVLESGIIIYKADLPVESIDQSNLKWKNNEIPVTAFEAGAIKAMLKDSMGINDSESTVEKIKKIGRYLGHSLYGTCGAPSDTVNGLPVFQQYKAATQGHKIWCGNYAGIFNLFARSANIKTRTVEVGRTYGSIKGNRHVFNEYYISEQKKWAAADLTSNNISYVDASGNLLNAVEIKNLNFADTSVKILKAGLKDSLFLKPVSTAGAAFFDFFGRDKNLWFYKTVYTNNVYSYKQKMKRYITKDSWYEIYSDTMVADNFNFYLKLLLLAVEIVLLLLLFTIFILNVFLKG